MGIFGSLWMLGDWCVGLLVGTQLAGTPKLKALLDEKRDSVREHAPVKTGSPS